MIENLPFSLIVVTCIITVLAGMMMTYAFVRGHHRAQQRAHLFALALLGWSIFQATLALNRWFMDKKTGTGHLLFPIVFSSVLILLLAFTPRGARFLRALRPSWLYSLQYLRIPIASMFYILATWKQTPWEMTFYGMNFDIAFGGIALLCMPIFPKKKSKYKLAFSIFNVVGIASIVWQYILVLGSVPSDSQWLGLTQPNYAATHFPYGWFVTVIFPLILASNVAMLVQNLTHHEKPIL
jgi:hypothetical protein